MDLKFISQNTCPICGCSLIVEENIEQDIFDKFKYRQHCNGGRWEKRRFACGQVLEYCPNASKTMNSDTYVCTNNKDYKDKKEKKLKALESVKAYIDTLDVDSEYKDSLKLYLY